MNIQSEVRATLEAGEQPSANLVSLLADALDEAEAAIQRATNLCHSMDRGVGYRKPGDHSTWSEYCEGKSDFAGAILGALEGERGGDGSLADV